MQFKKETTVGIFILLVICSFFYMSYKIGFFRFDKIDYASYKANFSNISGLVKRADVKISGVKVGWVESIDLTGGGSAVEADLMISKQFPLSKNAQARITQDGFLGAKFVEIVPGEAENSKLNSGESLNNSDKDKPSIDDLLVTFGQIAQNLNEISGSLKETLVNKNNIKQLKKTVKSFNQAAEKISTASNTIERVITSNEKSLNNIVLDINNITNNIKNKLPNITENIEEVAQMLNGDPLVKNFKKNFSSINSAATKFRTCADKISNVRFGLDNHNDFFFHLNKPVKYNGFQSHLNFWIHPNNRCFMLGGIVPSKLKTFDKNLSFNLQLGGFFNRAVFRVGLFESTFGMGVDYIFPNNLVNLRNLRWISTCELFDLTGKNRSIKEHYPHLKWMNRLYFSPNFYLSFGIDDFVSKFNKNAFVGIGLNFGDTYFKY